MIFCFGSFLFFSFPFLSFVLSGQSTRVSVLVSSFPSYNFYNTPSCNVPEALYLKRNPCPEIFSDGMSIIAFKHYRIFRLYYIYKYFE